LRHTGRGRREVLSTGRLRRGTGGVAARAVTDLCGRGEGSSQALATRARGGDARV